MIKYLTLLLSLGILNAMAHSGLCPTCPKGYSVIKLEELLLMQRIGQSAPSKLNDKALSYRKITPTKDQKSAIDIVKCHTDKLRKSHSDPYVSKTSSKIDPPVNQFWELTKRLEPYSYNYKRRK